MLDRIAQTSRCLGCREQIRSLHPYLPAGKVRLFANIIFPREHRIHWRNQRRPVLVWPAAAPGVEQSTLEFNASCLQRVLL